MDDSINKVDEIFERRFVMNSAKQTLQTLVDQLPEDCTLEDAQRRI
jgi:hypothetical protein